MSAARRIAPGSSPAMDRSSPAEDLITIGALLAAALAGLKLAHEIGWPWWAVLSPLWPGAALVLVILAAAAVAGAAEGMKR